MPILLRNFSQSKSNKVENIHCSLATVRFYAMCGHSDMDQWYGIEGVPTHLTLWC